MNPKVSIVIPCFNAESTIAEAIDSVLTQTEQDFEIVIVDDASQDNTYRVAKAQCGLRGHIIQQKENRGPAAARNTAFSVATGRWVCILDADDVLAPNYLEVMMAHAAKCAEIFVGCDIFPFGGNVWPGHSGRSAFHNAGLSSSSTPINSLAEFIRLGIDVKPFFPLDAIHRHRIRQQGQGSEWLEFIADLYRCGLRLDLTNETRYYYRVHGANFSSRYEQVNQEIAACDRLLGTSWISDDARDALLKVKAGLRRHRPWKALHRGLILRAILDFAIVPTSILHSIPLLRSELSKRLTKIRLKAK